MQVSGRGRGLVATRGIRAAEVVHLERPMLCYPAFEVQHQVCYHCLAALPPGAELVRHGPTGRRFCSGACLRSALSQYLSIEAAVVQAEKESAQGPSGPRKSCLNSFGQLGEECRQSKERFPMLAVRLAHMAITQALKRALSTGTPEAAGGGTATHDLASPWVRSHEGSPPCQGDPLTAMHVLCYANVGKPYPDPWVAQHSLLASSLECALADQELLHLAAVLAGSPPDDTVLTGDRSPPQREGAPLSEGGARGQALVASARRALESLGVDWFVKVLARLHLNTFQVHNPLAGQDASDLAAAAAALVSGTAGGGSTGSAVYLVGSLFNHSCAPALDVSFPACDGTAAFAAARDIEVGEELTVSYLDVGLPLDTRRRHLEWSYGFVCGCARCKEEEAGGAW